MSIKKNIIVATIISMFMSTSIVSAYEQNVKVFIDAGHGGRDNGSVYGEYVEDNINLQIAKKVENKLLESGIKVQMSRNDNEYISLSKRAKMANNSGADLFISIHQNAALNKGAKGVETFYMGDENKKLAQTIQENVLESTNALDRQIKKGNLQVLRESKIPAVLLECGFISNDTEGYNLYTYEYQNKVANGIVNGIKEYLDIEQNESVSSKNYKTALNDVNVMSDRGKNFKVIGTLKAQTQVEVIDTKFDWHKINYNGKIGYVSAVYVK